MVLYGLRQVRAFLAAARLNSFTRAAAELHVSQSTLTIQIKNLEDELGVVLFERNKKHVSLTPSGMDLLPSFERVLADAGALFEQAHGNTGLQRGSLRIAAVPSLAAQLLPEAISEFSERFPGVVFRVKSMSSRAVVEAVKNGEADFGLGCPLLPVTGLQSELLFTDRICAFLSRRHPLAGQSEVSLATLAEQPLLMPPRNTALREIVEQAFRKQHLDVVPILEADSLPSLIGMASVGLGIAIASGRVGAMGVGRQLSRVPIGQPILSLKIVILQRKDRSLPFGASEMIDMVKRASEPMSAP